MKFDGPALAHAWLAVFAAACTRKDGPAALVKTIAIEEHPTGIRLLATDGFVLLTAWVPDLDHYEDSTGPEIDEAPERVVIASDDDGRARSLLGYVISLANRIPEEEYVEGSVPMQLLFDVRMPAGQAGTQEALDGMEPTYVVLSVPDVERVYLTTVPAKYPDWRPLVAAHTPKRTDKIRLNPELVERLAKVRKHAAGALHWSFGGAKAAALIEYVDSDPFVHGVVMPMKDPDEVAKERHEPDEVSESVEALRKAAEALGGIEITHTPAGGGKPTTVTVGKPEAKR
jgi:hypothetical protein